MIAPFRRFFVASCGETCLSWTSIYVLSCRNSSDIICAYIAMRDSHTYFACLEFKVQLTYFSKVLQVNPGYDISKT